MGTTEKLEGTESFNTAEDKQNNLKRNEANYCQECSVQVDKDRTKS